MRSPSSSVIARFLAAADRGDTTEAVQYFRQDAIIISPHVLDGRPLVGRDAIRSFLDSRPEPRSEHHVVAAHQRRDHAFAEGYVVAGRTTRAFLASAQLAAPTEITRYSFVSWLPDDSALDALGFSATPL